VRDHSGKTQQEIATLLGVSRPTVSGWSADSATNVKADNSCAPEQTAASPTESHDCRTKVSRAAKDGELLLETPKNRGAKGNPGGRGNKNVRCQNGTTHPKLTDLGISKKVSARSQACVDSSTMYI
jgi:uncharacterized protein YjcR